MRERQSIHVTAEMRAAGAIALENFLSWGGDLEFAAQDVYIAMVQKKHQADLEQSETVFGAQKKKA